jgi:hypothetical protein
MLKILWLFPSLVYSGKSDNDLFNNLVCKRVYNKFLSNSCREKILLLNVLEAGTGVFWELDCSETASFSEPQLPPEVASLKHALLA